MLLKIGSSGDDVKKLQEKLGIGSDGSFGPGTESAVKKWQSSNGLTPDGIVGDVTWGKMSIGSITPNLSTSTPINLNKLKGRVPDSVINQIPVIMEKFQINTTLRLSHFLSQCQHESGNFSIVNENLNYSAARLGQVFPSYFKNKDVNQYGGHPDKIASLVYGSRMGNGSEATGDGYKFRGRGYIQLTGKENYTLFTQSIGEDCVSTPDLVSTKYPLASAAWFFSKNGLNLIADKGATDDIVTQITKRVNGGTIGLEDRIKHFNELNAILA